MKDFKQTTPVNFHRDVKVNDIVRFEHFDKMYIGRIDEIKASHYSNGDKGYRILANQNAELMPTQQVIKNRDYSDWAYWVKLEDISMKFIVNETEEEFGSFEYFSNLFKPNKK